MWLLNVRTFCLECFIGSQVPEYAILSHTWGNNEVAFGQVRNELAFGQVRDALGIHEGPVGIDDGASKIAYTCELAIQDELDYVWIDTCCIDKSSSAELSEAINSMFQWYQRAEVCYAYLSDVHSIDDPDAEGSQFRRSKWFTRGWTLQELLAPQKLRFYSRSWRLIAPVTALYRTIEEVTGIQSMYLRRASSQWTLMFRSASVARRMSWAAGRQTTRVEDMAYCLLGIFNINMPLLYGEGTKAFLRLQEEIMKQSDDETILAWGWGNTLALRHFEHGFLASSPACFAGCQDLTPWQSAGGGTSFSITNRGLQIKVPVIHTRGNDYLAFLRCSDKTDGDYAVSLPLRRLDDGGSKLNWNDLDYYSRTDKPPSTQYQRSNGFFFSTNSFSPKVIRISQRPWWPSALMNDSWTMGFYVRKLPAGCVVVNAWPLDEWLPLDNAIAVAGGDLSHPRVFCIRYWDREIIVRLTWQQATGAWVSDVAKRDTPGQTMRHLLELEIPRLEFGSKVSVTSGLHVKISMQEELLFGKKLMVIDLCESLIDWARAKADETSRAVLFVTGTAGVLTTVATCGVYLGAALVEGTRRPGLGVVLNL
ncbi:hypothetical protein OQA88_12451 [Cercophora sp. LCS_1]